MIPLMEKEFVGDGKLETKENFEKDVLIASLTPGALPVELASALGWRNFGGKGMLFSAFGISLPGVLASLLLLTCLSGLRAKIGGAMEILSVLISIYIVILILRYIRKVFLECKHTNPIFFQRACIVMVGVFALSFFISTLCILLTAFAVIIIVNFFRCDRRYFQLTAYQQEKNNGMIIWIFILLMGLIPSLILSIKYADLFSYFMKCCLSVLMSFGGGDAYLAVADGLFVDTGFLSSEAFYGDIVPIANILPGSILCKALTGIGFYHGFALTNNITGALAFALVGYVSSVSISCMVFHIVSYLYSHLSNFRTVQTISHYIGPIICGLLGSVIVSLIYSFLHSS